MSKFVILRRLADVECAQRRCRALTYKVQSHSVAFLRASGWLPGGRFTLESLPQDFETTLMAVILLLRATAPAAVNTLAASCSDTGSNTSLLRARSVMALTSLSTARQAQ